MKAKRLLAAILFLVLILTAVFPVAYAVDDEYDVVEEEAFYEDAYAGTFEDDSENDDEDDPDEILAAAALTPQSHDAAVTWDDVTKIVNEYLGVAKNKYWNANIRSSGTSKLKTMAYEKTVTSTGCQSGGVKSQHSHSKTTSDGTPRCTSNLFAGVGSVDNSGNFKVAADAQCSGFAAYMEYVIFHTTDTSKFKLCYGTGNKSLSKLANNVIKPGDQLRYNGHSYVIYKVDSSKAYYIQCNTSNADCKITTGSETLSSIKTKIGKCNGTSSGYFSSPAVESVSYTLHSYENHSGKNYLVGTDFEGSLYCSYWSSRNTDVTTLTSDSQNKHNGYNSIRIDNKSAGSSGNDLSIQTMTQGNVKNNGYVGDSKSMILSFWAKSSSDGTKMYFRYGHEENYRSVTLSKEWQQYSVRMDKTTACGNYLHPYVDRAGSVWLAEVQLEDGTTATEFIPEDRGEYKTVTETSGKKYTLPAAPTWEGHQFLGWFTSASGGSQITTSTAVKNGNFSVYAHWDSYNTGLSQELANPDYVLPSELTDIREEAFLGVRTERIQLSTNIKVIGPRAFANSGSLNLIIIPAASVSIADDAFAGSGNVRIAAPAGGSVEQYAKSKGIGFIAIQ